MFALVTGVQTCALPILELLRGAQSALCGAQALGGVNAVTTPLPTQEIRAEARGEYGSHDSRRATALLSAGNDKGGVSLDGAWLKTNGIDTLGRGGERDGHENLSLGAKAVVRPAPDGELGLRSEEHTSELQSLMRHSDAVLCLKKK